MSFIPFPVMIFSVVAHFLAGYVRSSTPYGEQSSNLSYYLAPLISLNLALQIKCN